MAKTKDKTETMFCVGCESALMTVKGQTAPVCVNVDCPEAQDAATRDADRQTAKTTVKASRMEGQPRAFTSTGRVD